MDQTISNTLVAKIVRGNGHGHFVIEPEDKDEFLAAGFVLAGTVTEDMVTRFLVRLKGDYERNDINPSQRPEYFANQSDRRGVGKVEVDVASPSGDEGGSGTETGSPAAGDADAGISNSGN